MCPITLPYSPNIYCDLDLLATGPMAHSVRLWPKTQRYWVRILAGSHCHRGCVYRPTVLQTTTTVLQTVKRHVVCSTVYGTVPILP